MKHYSYVLYSYLTEETQIQENLADHPPPQQIRFACRHPGCKSKFKLKDGRKKHEKQKHDLMFEIDETPDDPTDDHVYNYARCNLVLGMLQWVINDSIKEGDGESLLDFYKIVLLYFKTYGRVKYGFTLAKLLLRIHLYEPDNADMLTWNRFVNTHGRGGKNISLDLHMEHLNRCLKDMLSNLGPNLNEKNAQRLARSMRNVNKVLGCVDNAIELTHSTSLHKSPQDIEDVQKLTMEFHKAELFKKQAPRQHPSFPHFPRSLLSDLDMDKFLLWLHEKDNQFSRIYGDVKL